MYKLHPNTYVHGCLIVYTAFTLAKKKVCQHCTARHGTGCFVSVNACIPVLCRVKSCCADPLYKNELTRYSTTQHHFFGSVNESEPKWAVLALKNLHLGTS